MSQENPRILLIDGKLVSRKFYAKLLRQSFPDNYEIYECESGIKGVILCDRKVIDCVLIAWQLPDMTASEFMAQLKERLGTDSSASVIIISEVDHEEGGVLAMKLGAFDYLIKGKFSPVSLAQSVKNAIENAKLRRELARSQKRHLDNAHKAGMAEIANGVLHNIGNNLNSLSVSLETVRDTVEKSKLHGLNQANELLETLGEQLAQHPKGLSLLKYYKVLAANWDKESEEILAETHKIREKFDLISNDVHDQTRYANAGLYLEDLEINNVLQEVLNLLKGRLEEKKIKINTHFNMLPHCKVVRAKILQILNNLVKNSIESLAEIDEESKLVTVATRPENEDHYAVTVTDNGSGISQEIIEKVFNYGFTTKKDAHGTGLHVAANAATEMGGSLNASSSGPGEGCTITLTLPYAGEKVQKGN